MTVKPSIVIHTMRRLNRDQVRTSDMDREALDYIREHKLIEEILWPSAFLKLTEAGAEYIAENSA